MCLSAIGSAICCAGESICRCCCCLCKSCCGSTLKQQVRLAYVIMTIIFILFTLFGLFLVKETFNFLNTFGTWISCPDKSGGQLQCFGVSALYRTGFSLMILFFFLFLCMMMKSKISKIINEDFWTLKILSIITLFIIFLFVNNSFFEGYVTFSKVFGALFMIFQSIMLIDLFYMWGRSWAERYHEGD